MLGRGWRYGRGVARQMGKSVRRMTSEETSTGFEPETPLQRAIWLGSLGVAGVALAYGSYRVYSEYFTPEASESANVAAERIPLYVGNPVVFMDFAVEGEDVGRVVFQLRKDRAPRMVENFRRLCTGEKGFSLAGSPIHSVVAGQYLLGGDVTHGTGVGGRSAMGGPVSADRSKLRHVGKGILSMDGPVDEFTSRFLLSFTRLPLRDGRNPVIGNVVTGLDVLDTIDSKSAAIARRKNATGDKTPPAITIKNCGELRLSKEDRAKLPIYRTAEKQKPNLATSQN